MYMTAFLPSGKYNTFLNNFYPGKAFILQDPKNQKLLRLSSYRLILNKVDIKIYLIF